MSAEQNPTQQTGKLGTHVDGLRSFGQEIVGQSETIKGMGFGGVFGNVAMPGGSVARALAAAGEACESAVSRVHDDYVFGGEASVNDARMFQERDEDNAAGIRSAIERGGGV